MSRFFFRVSAALLLLMAFATGCGHQEQPSTPATPAPLNIAPGAQAVRSSSKEGLRNAARMRGQMMQRGEQKH